MEKNFLLVLFYSASGSVKNLAHAIADGIEDVGLDVRLRTVPKISSNVEQIEDHIPAVSYTHLTLPTIYSV